MDARDKPGQRALGGPHHVKRAGVAQRAAAVRPLTRARPRSTSTASLNCSSLVVPISPEATEGCSPFAGCVVALGSLPGVVAPPGAFAGAPPGVPLGAAPCAGVAAPVLAAAAAAGAGFFSAPRRPAPRRPSV